MNVPSPYGRGLGRGRRKMKIDPQLLEFAKSMRHTATDAEELLWQIIYAKHFMSLKFLHQHVSVIYANI